MIDKWIEIWKNKSANWKNTNIGNTAKFLVNELNIKKEMKVFSIGCGNGDILYNLGVDFIDGCDIRDNPFRLLEANNLLGVDDNCFDIVFSNTVFQYFPSLDYAANVINEMFRICKPSGIVFISDVNDIDLYADLIESRKCHGKHLTPPLLFYSRGFFHMFGNCSIKNNFPFTNNSKFRFNIKYKLKGWSQL